MVEGGVGAHRSEETIMRSIVTITMNPALDMSTQVGQVLAEQKLLCQAPRLDPGGGGINVSRAIHKLGGASTALYLVGGAIGEQVQSLLSDEGVDHRPIHIEGTTRTSFTVLEESSGQQYRFGMPGPEVREHEWRSVLEHVKALAPSPGYLVASGSLPPGVPNDFLARLAVAAAGHEARFIVDTRGEPLRAALERGVFLVKPNMRELGLLVRRDITTEGEQERAARRLVDEGKCEVVVTSLGAEGALVVTRELCVRIRAPTVEVVSKIGAGDSTVAGMVLSLARGDDLLASVRYGVAAGAAAVMTPGTQLCRREDVERLLNPPSPVTPPARE